MRPGPATAWLTLAVAVAACSGAAGSDPQPAGTATVTDVIDGDTIVVDLDGNDELVRLIGIDTPETVHPDQPEECFGAEASARTGQLIPAGTDVRLVRDVEARDRFDRLLAYVYRQDDDLFVNLALVAEGFADSVVYGENHAFAGRFGAAESAARDGGLGLWTACGSADVPLG